jgi:hypothetical protein
MLLDGEVIPKLLPIEAHRTNPEYLDGIWGLVEIDISQLSPKSKRVNITYPSSYYQLLMTSHILSHSIS